MHFLTESSINGKSLLVFALIKQFCRRSNIIQDSSMSILLKRNVTWNPKSQILFYMNKWTYLILYLQQYFYSHWTVNKPRTTVGFQTHDTYLFKRYLLQTEDKLQPLTELRNLQPLTEIKNLQPQKELRNLQPLTELRNLQLLTELRNLPPLTELRNFKSILSKVL